MDHADSAKSRNHLTNATSPYLLQHADNPVEWYEWGSAALERARQEDKPIFLSIGYSACHWCHVMAHESFEREEIAAVMNVHFINIKVDREERPDIDELYMRATILANRGQGGWPMSVWLTPDLKPFYAGTYFPPEAYYGRPGFKELCAQIGSAWHDRRDEITKAADGMTDAVARSLTPTPPEDPQQLTRMHLEQAALMFGNLFDREFGGVSGGGTNKFPPSGAIDLMLRSAARDKLDTQAKNLLRTQVVTTLDRMAAGGIRDHLAGGFARYSVDVEWHVPHFEKMLYDQALVSGAYLDGYLVFGTPLYAEVAREICDYVLDDFAAPSGGFFSARDADSEGEEGKYYVWTYAEVQSLLTPEESAAFCAYYDVRPNGNWDDPHFPGVAKNVLRIVTTQDALATKLNCSMQELQALLERGRQKLRAARNDRVEPGLDDKRLLEWNGLMISSLARIGAALDEPRYIDAAANAARALLGEQSDNGTLFRAWRDGRRLELGFLTDYAALIAGLIDLYEATFDAEWLTQARALTATTLEHFWDSESAGFFFTRNDHEALIARSKEASDGAVPGGNSLMLGNLLRLAAIFDDRGLRDRADKMIAFYGPHLIEQPGAGERFLAAADLALTGSIEVVIVGNAQDAKTRALLSAVRTTYAPRAVRIHHDPQQPTLDTPLIANRTEVDGAPAAYVCEGGVCQRPVTDPDALRQLLIEVAAR